MNPKLFLRHALAERIRKNSQYSLRSFARQAGVSASHISRVLNGESRLSIKTALKIASKLDLSPGSARHFIDLVNYDNAGPEARAMLDRSPASKKTVKQTLNMEMFEIISDWYYLPIYELLKSSKFIGSESAVAKQFGLSVAEVKAALDRLVRVGLVSVDRGRIYKSNTGTDFETLDDVPSSAIRSHHRKMMAKAAEALDEPVHSREFQSLQLAIDPKKFKCAQTKIRQFLDEFESEFRTPDSRSIYQLSLHCFPLNKEVQK